jgi:hypothetical protein
MQVIIEARRTKASKKSIAVRGGNLRMIPADGTLVHVVYKQSTLAVTIDGDPVVDRGYIHLKAIAKSGSQFDKIAGE